MESNNACYRVVKERLTQTPLAGSKQRLVASQAAEGGALVEVEASAAVVAVEEVELYSAAPTRTLAIPSHMLWRCTNSKAREICKPAKCMTFALLASHFQ
eukprot:5620762-Amphidinium_carterae.1